MVLRSKASIQHKVNSGKSIPISKGKLNWIKSKVIEIVLDYSYMGIIYSLECTK